MVEYVLILSAIAALVVSAYNFTGNTIDHVIRDAGRLLRPDHGDGH